MPNLQFKFSFKYFGQFIVYSISNINFCFLINKLETYVKTKYNVSFLKPYLDSNETKVTSDEKPLPSAIDEKLHDIVNADFPSLTHCPQNEVFHEGFLQQMRPNLQETAGLVTFAEEIFHGKFHLLCRDRSADAY